VVFAGAAAARNGLEDLYLFAGTGVLDKMPDVDDALETGVQVILAFAGWVRGYARLLCAAHGAYASSSRAAGE
jgi:hypothetical protein